jgi:hypothetical protein
MISPPSRGKPVSPRNESQITPGPLVEAPKIPQMGSLNKSKVMPGKFSGRVMRVGKK